MSAVTSVSLRGALFLWALLSSSEVSVPLTIKNITAVPGENVSLPCRVPNTTPVIVLKWIRTDHNKSQDVFMYKDEKPLSEKQHPSFKNRVDLKDKHMKDGNVSVILKNVTRNDSGTYTCLIIQTGWKHRRRRRRASFEPVSSIILDVHKGRKSWTFWSKDKEAGERKGNSRNHYVLVAPAFVILFLFCFFSITWLTHKMTKRKAPHPADPVLIAGIQQQEC